MQIDTVSEAFIEYLQNEGVATFNTDLFIGRVPSNAPDTAYWVITSGGSPIQKLRTGEKVKQYFISVYYRSRSGRDIEKNLFSLEEKLNSPDCVNLTGFEVIEVECQQFPTDTDIDNEERRIGFLQANIKIYKKES